MLAVHCTSLALLRASVSQSVSLLHSHIDKVVNMQTKYIELDLRQGVRLRTLATWGLRSLTKLPLVFILECRTQKFLRMIIGPQYEILRDCTTLLSVTNYQHRGRLLRNLAFISTKLNFVPTQPNMRIPCPKPSSAVCSEVKLLKYNQRITHFRS